MDGVCAKTRVVATHNNAAQRLIWLIVVPEVGYFGVGKSEAAAVGLGAKRDRYDRPPPQATANSASLLSARLRWISLAACSSKI
jgi:hypothetical protein